MIPAAKRWFAPAVFAICGAWGAAAGVGLAQDAKENTWQGTWNNRKFGTSGPLRCTASSKDGKTFEAQFRSTFRGRESTYSVTFTGTKKSDRTLLEGTATIDGDSYRWNGYISGRTLVGNFRSGSGNNGSFKLDQK